jgi:hypothetical protein
VRCVIRAVDPTALILVSRLLAFALLVSLVVLAGCGGGTRAPGGPTRGQPRGNRTRGNHTTPQVELSGGLNIPLTAMQAGCGRDAFAHITAAIGWSR